MHIDIKILTLNKPIQLSGAVASIWGYHQLSLKKCSIMILLTEACVCMISV